MRRPAGAALALALCAACGPKMPDVFIDASTQTTCVSEPFDGGPGCLLPDDFGPEHMPSVSWADIRMADDGTVLVHQQVCKSAHLLSIQIYPGRGVFSGVDAGHGDFSLGGIAEQSFATCGACVRIFADADAHGEPTTTYMATGGTLHIATLGSPGGDPFDVTLDDVTFREVTIDPITFATVPAGSCTSHILDMEVKGEVRPVR